MNENMEPKVEMENQRATDHGGSPHFQLTPTSNEKIQSLKATTQKASNSDEISEDRQLPQLNIKNGKIHQDLPIQWKEIHACMHQGFLKYKSESNTKRYCKNPKKSQ